MKGYNVVHFVANHTLHIDLTWLTLISLAWNDGSRQLSTGNPASLKITQKKCLNTPFALTQVFWYRTLSPAAPFRSRLIFLERSLPLIYLKTEEVSDEDSPVSRA